MTKKVATQEADIQDVSVPTIPVQELSQVDNTSLGVVLTRIAFVFLIGGFAGWLYEVCICAPLNGVPIDFGHGGLGIPFLMIYAIGSVAIELAFGLGRQQFHPAIQLIESAVLATALEYASGLTMLHVLQVQTWDYRIPGWDFLVTPDGLICLRASLTFGLMGLLQLRGVGKLYEWLVAKHYRVLVVIIWVLVGVVVLAMLNAFLFHAIDTGGTWH
ncbi:MAG: putative ABC transporter permease [Atopobium sp.]|uniref:putative ABC transporter permease n=2 Tax=Atopobium sp. TaxID=1872650 RepID=UPI002A82459B|nr:putative ABC transporter permease [Atopobium sp.]MDY4522960.1 putative ABC transporter permease [Atopobium sp.]